MILDVCGKLIECLVLVGEMVTLSTLRTAYDAIYMRVNTVAPRFLNDVKNLKFVYTDSRPATVSEI